MVVGVPVEIKENENRVSMTPYAVHTLVNDGHEVLIQDSAGVKSGFSNDEYKKNGARIVGTLDEVYQQSDMIVKVKEPRGRAIKDKRVSDSIYLFSFCGKQRTY